MSPLRLLTASVLVLALLPGASAFAGTQTTASTALATTTSLVTDWVLTTPGITPEPRAFSPNSFWNTPLAATQQPDANSAALVSDLVRQVATYGPYISTTSYAVPVYTVPASQARVPVTLDSTNTTLKAAFAAGVPVPSNASGAAGTDASVSVWQPSTDTVWEFWRLKKLSDGWHTGYGGVIAHASTSSGVFPAPYGAAASGLSFLGGMMRPSEFYSGSMNHVVSFSVPEVTAGTIVSPASRTDGNTIGAGIPEGTRFQLDPSLDIASLAIPAATKTVARAAQKYGMIVTDRSGVVSLAAEDPLTMTSNPWPFVFGWLGASQVMSAFPWSKLRALPPTAGLTS
jgi:hypothetical protein